MAKEKDAMRTRIESIKTDLQRISTCNAATVAELRDLLAEKTAEFVQKENIRVKTSQPLSVQRRKAGTARLTAAADVPRQAASTLSSREKYILATEVVNTSLKYLADALKTQPSPQVVRASSKAKPSDPNARKPFEERRTHTKSASVSTHPLKERSISQVINSPTKPSVLRRSSSYSSFLTTAPDSGLVATAGCARIAFAYLGTSEAAKIAGKDSPELQLENGILALVGKLVAHGLDNLAIKEMRILKRRLDGHLGVDTRDRDGQSATTKRQPNQDQSAGKESLASLLEFGDVDRRSPALAIITNLQTYALRVIARIKRPRIIEDAWNCLALSHPSSPANLVWHIAKSSDNQEKAARQLESLAQTILSLCPSISSSADQEDLQPSPDVVLCLQHLAFRTRHRWWALAKHQGDVGKELLEPFSKCIVAFSRRSKLPPTKRYKLAESLYTDLLETAQDSNLAAKNGMHPDTLPHKTLSSLAQAAGLTEDALRWLGTPNSPTSKGSAARQAARLTRIAAVSLEAMLKDGSKEDIEVIISAALDALSDAVGGSSPELNALLMEVNALRRIATRVLMVHDPTTLPPDLEALQRQCIHTVAATIHFTARFIGTMPSSEADAKPHVRYQERLSMASRFLKSSVDSVLVCFKRPLHSTSSWEELDALLQDCARFLSHFEEESDSWSVKLSNACWAMHLQLRKVSAEPAVVAAAMQRSIDLLQTRSQKEKEAGLLAMKLERLAESLDQLGRVDDSRKAFVRCIQSLMDTAQQQGIAEVAATHSVPQIFESAGIFGTLGRILKSYHRSFVKYGLRKSDGVAFFDDCRHAPSARGTVLEWQLALYQKTLSRNRQWDSSLNLSILAMVERLLDIYPPTRFPVRHQRVLLVILQISQAYPEIVSTELVSPRLKASGDGEAAQAEDQGLSRFKEHLKAQVNLKFALQESKPPVAIIQDCFSTWQSLVDSAASWESLIDRIDNKEHWLQEMQACAEYLAAKGEEYESLPVLHLLVRVLELQQSLEPSDLVTTLCTFGLQLLRLGYSGKAGLAFAKAELLTSSRPTSTEAKLRWHFGYAEYLLGIGNATKCELVLSAAAMIAREDAQFMGLTKPSTTLSGRIRFNTILADACYVVSLLSVNKGHQKNAARYARQCVVLNRRTWAALETRSNSRKAAGTNSADSDSDSEGPIKSAFDPLSSMRNDKGIPLVMSVTHDALSGADFWSLVPSLYRGLMQHSLVFANQGLLQEAVYVAEQAEKVATGVHSPSLILDNASRRAEYWAQSGRPDKAQPILQALPQAELDTHVAKAAYYSSIARVHHSSKNFDDELAAYDSLEKLLVGLASPSYIKSLDTFIPSVEPLTNELSAMSLGKSELRGAGPEKDAKVRQATGKTPSRTAPHSAPRVTRKATLRSAPRPVPRTKANQKVAASVVPQVPSITAECASLCALEIDIAHRRALANLLQDNVFQAVDILERIEKLQRGLHQNITHAWTRFKTMLLQSTKDITEDFTFNTLPESTIAFPAIPPKERKSSDLVATNRPVIAPSTVKTSRSKKPAKVDFAESLRVAREHLVGAHAICANAGTSHAFQQVSTALGHVTILLSAVSGDRLRGSLHPLFAAYMSEIPKFNSLRLIQDTVEIEQESMSREEYLKWPELDSDCTPLASVTEFQKDYIDIIPESWTALALALNESQDELYITRYESGSTPFVLRLPMARHSSRDMDEETFTFGDGKRDFDEIIELSDFSTRNAKDMTSREARLQWWAEREALDTKLHELLLNIERIWLGGFKGIFSQHVRQPPLLARFRKSFENILNRHLPSRRKKSQQKKPVLDARVLELFVGLGDASNEELDLDDALTDLIYFVVDILQFNGERNAYDEIDFDAMVIETHDALRAYHGASPSAPPDNAHAILILDKNLHMFPWESLPCLEKLSISRLPSLAALRERIITARSPTMPNPKPGHYVSAEAGGTSMLNPSGDLSHTLKTIKPRLDEMQGSWTHIVNRAPTEKEFEDSLREKDLVLYFGHGSGAQFVRSKSVRRLYPGDQTDGRKPGCATTFLFGCSSVHLSDNGIYEPSGMLASYLTAGAPAVVGMLWDVTDKDCDRFAIKAGELWGLWPESKEEAIVDAPPTIKRSKGKGKVAQLVEEVESARGAGNGRRGRKNRDQIGGDADRGGSGSRVHRRGVGLDEAVRDSRDVCVLRYLNGAAAVVYGIPVYLE